MAVEALALSGKEETSTLSFTEIPSLPLSAARSPDTKPAFLESLRSALLNVGFFYLSDTGLPEELVNDVVRECQAFFEKLSDEEKLAIEMKQEKSFLGYSRLGNEVTAGASDWREQLDLSTPQPLPGPNDPLYYNLHAPNQWPSEKTLPGFRSAYEEYMRHMSEISLFFTTLIAEAIGLPANAFDKFFDKDQQHKLKLVKYPDSGTGVGQGVGPHKDSMLTSYLLQASPHRGLQAQNTDGKWVDCPPVDGTLVVVIGQGMEALTGGVCTSTTHRVLSPAAGSGARLSIPFFQGVSFDAKFENFTDEIPADIREMKRRALEKAGGRQDDIEFTFVKGRWTALGEATLMNRIKSHPDVGERWYPELLAQIREEQAQQQHRLSKEVPALSEKNSPQTNGSNSIIEAH